MTECNHDVDAVSATAQTFTLGYPEGSEEVTYCFECGEQIGPAVLTCGKCESSWQEELFDGCPWCSGEIEGLAMEDAWFAEAQRQADENA